MKTSHQRSVFESGDGSVATESRRPRNMQETLRGFVHPTVPPGAVVYCMVALRWALLWRRPLLFGTIYGLLVYGVMNIVLPMSAADWAQHRGPHV